MGKCQIVKMKLLKHLRNILANNTSSKNHSSALIKPLMKKLFEKLTRLAVPSAMHVQIVLFNFSLDEILTEIERLNRKKAIQATDIPNKVNENKDLISFYGYHNFTN